MESKPQVEAFIEYYVENNQTIAEEALFIPLNSEQETAPQDALKNCAAVRVRPRSPRPRDHASRRPPPTALLLCARAEGRLMTMTPSPTAAPGTPLGRPRPRWGERVIEAILVLAALVSIATTVAIVVALLPPTLEFFSEVSVLDFLTGTDWSPLFADPSFGVLPLLAGTLVITASQ